MTRKSIHVLNKRVELLQLEDGFKTAIDAVLLAAACPAKPGESVLDLGCGVGAAGLCVLSRIPETRLTGIDIQLEAVDLAKENAVLNKMNADFQQGNILDYRGKEADHVIMNPPFLEAGTHLVSPSEGVAKARGHLSKETTLEDWISCAFYNLKQLGSFSIIHRADHTDKIIQAFGKRFGAVEIIPLWPKANVPAKRVLIRAVKNRKTPAIIHPGLALHNEDGSYTAAAEKVLRDGESIL